MKYSAGVGPSRARFALYVFLLLATAVALYSELPGPADYIRIAALLGLIVVSTVMVERNRSLELLARIKAEREELVTARDAAGARADALERLIEFGERIGNLTDTTQLRDAILESLPPLVQTRDIWVTGRVGGWQDVFRTTDQKSPAPAALKQLAWETFPLRVHGKTIGVLGVRQEDRPFDAEERATLLKAASIIATALKNVQLFQRVREQSLTDPLTGCATRAHGMEILSAELRRAARSGGATSILMLDADHFKQINDTFGHQCGDEVLRRLGRALKGAVRTTDLPCRYGGEEFLVLLPDTSTSGAAKLAETIRKAIESETIAYENATIRISLSCGVATAVKGEIDPAALITRADGALYQAKLHGRNRVVVHGQDPQIPLGAIQRRRRGGPSGADRRDPRLPDRRSGPAGRRSTDFSRFHS